MADYVRKVLNSCGKVIIVDAAQSDFSFDEIVSILGLNLIRDFY